MPSTILSNSGQITIPEEIQKHLKLVSGSRVEFVIDEDGQVRLFPLNVPVETLSGILHRPGIQPATLEEMEADISKGASDGVGYSTGYNSEKNANAKIQKI